MPDHQHVLAKDERRWGYACVVHGCSRFVHVTEFDRMAFLEGSRVTQGHQCSSEPLSDALVQVRAP